MIRVALPHHLRTLSGAQAEVLLEVAEPVTVATVLDALEARFPMLCGTMRDHHTRKRRPMVRFYAEQQDVSLAPPEQPLPAAVATGREPLRVIAAISGG